MKRFGELLDKSINEYKENFGVIFWIFLALVIIPSLALGILNVFSVNFPEDITVQGYLSFVSIVYILLSAFSSVAIIYVILNKKKSSFEEALDGSSKYFLRYLFLIIILAMFFAAAFFGPILIAFLFKLVNEISFIVAVSIAIIIGICWFVYLAISWEFSYYFLVGENCGTFESIKKSSGLVKGKRKTVFGYLLGLALVVLAVAIVVGLFFETADFFITEPYATYMTETNIFGVEENVAYYPFNIQVFSAFISWFEESIVGIICYPLALIFSKNIYLSLRTKTAVGKTRKVKKKLAKSSKR